MVNEKKLTETVGGNSEEEKAQVRLRREAEKLAEEKRKEGEGAGE